MSDNESNTSFVIKGGKVVCPKCGHDHITHQYKCWEKGYLSIVGGEIVAIDHEFDETSEYMAVCYKCGFTEYDCGVECL